MHRRRFIKSLTALGSGLLVPPKLALPAQTSPPSSDPDVKRVLVMFKCHFDAGFIDTQANVVHKYFARYFPEAIHVTASQNAGRAPNAKRYIWTTGSWLLYEYLEQADPQDRRAMEQAIARGDIAWHALPFTWQTELLDQSLIEGALALSQSLDGRYGRTTVGAKMTDVPGHTRALIRPLVKQGITFLDIGVNDASTPAQLPPIFLWKDPSGVSLPVMYHHGYGDTTRVPNSDLVISIQVRDDNSGPHTPDEIAAIHAGLARRYPNAHIAAASLTTIANAVAPFRDSLPVVTGEIGDTWIYGVPSDPLKVARYREIARLRQSWIAANRMHPGDSTDLDLLRHLLLEVEHTWGTDTKTWLDFEHYTPADLSAMLATPNYKVVALSWQEKRQDLLDGIATLPEDLRTEATAAIDAFNPKIPLPSPQATPHMLNAPSQMDSIETAHFHLGLDPRTGAITRFRNKTSGRDWASAANPLALFTYQALSQQDYDRFIAAYIISKEDWAFKDFGKPNIEKFGARSQQWHPRLSELLVEETAGGHRILTTLAIDDPEALKSGRAAFPRQLYLELLQPAKTAEIQLNFYWFEKAATRLPEALWLTFNPIAPNPRGWTLDKSGEPVSPFEVIAGGNRHMHALTQGFSYKEGPHHLSIDTLDAPVVALGERTPLGFTTDQPDLKKGIHSNLYNNAWGTNYIMWYGEHMHFRYILRG